MGTIQEALVLNTLHVENIVLTKSAQMIPMLNFPPVQLISQHLGTPRLLNDAALVLAELYCKLLNQYYVLFEERMIGTPSELVQLFPMVKSTMNKALLEGIDPTIIFTLGVAMK